MENKIKIVTIVQIYNLNQKNKNKSKLFPRALN